MATYILVHGAWHGGWCWRRVVRILTGLRDTMSTLRLSRQPGEH